MVPHDLLRTQQQSAVQVSITFEITLVVVYLTRVLFGD